MNSPLGTVSPSAEPKPKGKKRRVEEPSSLTGEDDMKGGYFSYIVMSTF